MCAFLACAWEGDGRREGLAGGKRKWWCEADQSRLQVPAAPAPREGGEGGPAAGRDQGQGGTQIFLLKSEQQDSTSCLGPMEATWLEQRPHLLRCSASVKGVGYHSLPQCQH